MSRESASTTRCLAVWAGTTLAAALLLGWLLPDLTAAVSAPPSADRFEAWLVLGCEAAAAAGTGWLWLLVSLVALEAGGAAATRHRGVPAGVRRVVLAACGAGLVGGMVAPAYAAAPPSPLDGLPLPDRPSAVAPVGWSGPTTARPAATAGSGEGEAGPPRTVRVAPGDTLWDLAATELPAGASDAEIEARWRSVHAANREVIGPDPDLIRPGQQLRLPPPPAPRT